jgi:hypothetical protein
MRWSRDRGCGICPTRVVGAAIRLCYWKWKMKKLFNFFSPTCKNSLRWILACPGFEKFC